MEFERSIASPLRTLPLPLYAAQNGHWQGCGTLEVADLLCGGGRAPVAGGDGGRFLSQLLGLLVGSEFLRLPFVWAKRALVKTGFPALFSCSKRLVRTQWFAYATACGERSQRSFRLRVGGVGQPARAKNEGSPCRP